MSTPIASTIVVASDKVWVDDNRTAKERFEMTRGPGIRITVESHRFWGSTAALIAPEHVDAFVARVLAVAAATKEPSGEPSGDTSA